MTDLVGILVFFSVILIIHFLLAYLRISSLNLILPRQEKKKKRKKEGYLNGSLNILSQFSTA